MVDIRPIISTGNHNQCPVVTYQHASIYCVCDAAAAAAAAEAAGGRVLRCRRLRSQSLNST